MTTGVEWRLQQQARAFHKELRKQAKADVPRTIGETIRMAGLLCGFPIAFALGMFIAALSAVIFQNEVLVVYIGIFGGTFVVLALFQRLINLMLNRKPRRERKTRFDQLLAAKVIQLARERKERLDERNLFYSSPEWLAMRQRVIRAKGRVCAVCREPILNDSDVTVDHIRARSKFPKLALSRENLRVLCRGCNSRKGARSS